jgi:hypothetical protein
LSRLLLLLLLLLYRWGRHLHMLLMQDRLLHYDLRLLLL